MSSSKDNHNQILSYHNQEMQGNRENCNSMFDEAALDNYDHNTHDRKFGRSRDYTRYADILHFPHPVSKTRAPMAPLKRASTFSPFAALTGFESNIDETARFTSEEIFLDETEITVLNRRLQFLSAHLDEHTTVEITHFVPDTETHKGSDKSGGDYFTYKGIIQQIDLYNRRIVFCDADGIKQGTYSRAGKIIPIDRIVNIDGEIFTDGDTF